MILRLLGFLVIGGEEKGFFFLLIKFHLYMCIKMLADILFDNETFSRNKEALFNSILALKHFT